MNLATITWRASLERYGHPTASASKNTPSPGSRLRSRNPCRVTARVAACSSVAALGVWAAATWSAERPAGLRVWAAGSLLGRAGQGPAFANGGGAYR
jgi:hypothetical protein